jgi:hypothetical protein
MSVTGAEMGEVGDIKIIQGVVDSTTKSGIRLAANQRNAKFGMLDSPFWLRAALLSLFPDDLKSILIQLIDDILFTRFWSHFQAR